MPAREALIAEEYGRAGAICMGIPAERMKQACGKFAFLRIVSIGTPTPHPEPRTRFLQVPCEVEMRVDGKTQVETLNLNIRSMENQPDRWVVGGGF